MFNLLIKSTIYKWPKFSLYPEDVEEAYRKCRGRNYIPMLEEIFPNK